jgi:hypothetical protein
MKKGLILYPKADRTQLRAFYSDEVYFRNRARHFKRANPSWKIHLESFDEDDSAEFLSDMEKSKYKNLDLFAYIGHGGPDDLYSADIGGASGATNLATRLTAACNNGAVIIFYSCNSGSLSDSLLRDVYLQTLSKGFTLYGHNSAGRAGNNPDKTVFPPSGGAMLIDEALGVLAGAPSFRRAWNARMRNEVDTLWATFFLYSNDELLRQACRSPIRRAVRRNSAYGRTLGWNSELTQIRTLVGVTTTDADDLAIGIARWQFDHFIRKVNVDGILGPKSWRLMKPLL